MRTVTLLLASTVALAGCGGDDDGPTTPNAPDAPSSATVEAGAATNTFTPPSVTVARGGTVTWTFGARPHNATFNDVAGAPATVPTTTNAQVSRTFATAGTFPYNCTLHPGMTGTVVVQ